MTQVPAHYIHPVDGKWEVKETFDNPERRVVAIFRVCSLPLSGPAVTRYIADKMEMVHDTPVGAMRIGSVGSEIRMLLITHIEQQDDGQWLPVALVNPTAQKRQQMRMRDDKKQLFDGTLDDALRRSAKTMCDIEDEASLMARQLENELVQPFLQQAFVIIDQDKLPPLELAAVAEISVKDRLPVHDVPPRAPQGQNLPDRGNGQNQPR